MQRFGYHAGLTLPFPPPPLARGPIEDVVTEEAGVLAPSGRIVRVTPLTIEDEVVAQGAPVACLRGAPEVHFVAPMPARVARITLQPGRKLSEIVLFHEPGGDILRHDTSGTVTEAGMRCLMQKAGIWPWLRRRPFGGMPPSTERPAAIMVMAADTRPLAPDPRRALEGRGAALTRGLGALASLTDGPILVCQQPGPPLFDPGLGDGRVRAIPCGPRHPQGSVGLQLLNLAPASVQTPVWDIHAEDVAALGDLLDTGILPMTRLVRVAGAGLRSERLVRTHPGADLRQLTRRLVSPGAHLVLSGSPLDGHQGHWLAPRDRQVTVLPRPVTGKAAHWLVTALTRSSRPRPIIPTAALTQAFGFALPAAPFARALSSGNDEMAMKLGVLSLLEEDVALADYVLGGEAHLADLLCAMLDRIQTELAA